MFTSEIEVIKCYKQNMAVKNGQSSVGRVPLGKVLVGKDPGFASAVCGYNFAFKIKIF